MTNRRPITPKIRFEVLKRDGFACSYCGARAGEEVRLVVDHIHPHSRGGPSGIDNYTTACETCNSGKSAGEVLVDRLPWELLGDHLCEKLYDIFGEDFDRLRFAIATEIASLTHPGPADGVPFDALVEVMTSERLWRLVSNLGIEDPRDAFNFEAFGVACWLEIASKRQELGMPDWRPPE